ncbi:MAG: bifunctional tetrahydrofolate synthase/dihydrofolate synthase [Candidatus Polarisedimenticolaceae bacterium]|nr:bifunctional tetrahydrofolate synthase/dihydrofolate synthase [Candidatus Polarisedimenticolaceae bacterium]
MRFQTLAEWLSWQEQLHPKEIDLGLERISAVWSRMHPAGLSSPVISVAGTNGKGSSVALLDSILRAAGYRTGCYTSPHFQRYNERIHIDGAEVTDQALCQSFERIDQSRNGLALTYFEFSTLAALDLFIAANLDVVILEVGLGGRLDAVNMIDADAALITTISMDHMDWLGDDLSQIGREKAGIMRRGKPVIFGSSGPQSVIDAAHEKGAKLYLVDQDYHYTTESRGGWQWQSDSQCYGDLPQLALVGAFQKQNAAAVIMLLNALKDRLSISEEAIRSGLQQATLVGRFQRIERRVPIYLDVAHNPEAAQALHDNVSSQTVSGPVYAIFSMLADKELAAVVKTMSPLIDRWFLAPLNTDRAATIEQLIEVVSQQSDSWDRFSSVADALAAAEEQLPIDGQVVVFGSFFTVAEALESL